MSKAKPNPTHRSWPKPLRGLAKLVSRVGLIPLHVSVLDKSRRLARGRRRRIHSKKMTGYLLMASIVFVLLLAAAMIGILLRVGVRN